MKSHYSKRYKKRIAELETQVKQYSRLVVEVENNSRQNLILFKEEQKKRQALEVELKKQRILILNFKRNPACGSMKVKIFMLSLKK